MKKIILLVMLFVTSLCYCQTFEVSTEAGQGFKFKDYNNPQLYMVNTSIVSSFNFLDNKLNLQAPVMGAFSDGDTYLFSGTQILYEVYKKTDLTISPGVSALFGSEGRQLYGLNLKVGLSEVFYITLNARQEYTHKEFWFDGSLGLNIIK